MTEEEDFTTEGAGNTEDEESWTLARRDSPFRVMLNMTYDDGSGGCPGAVIVRDTR